jgi:hypothetical protein
MITTSDSRSVVLAILNVAKQNVGLKKIQIVFDNPWSTYNSGQPVTGRLLLTVNSPKKIQGMLVVMSFVPVCQLNKTMLICPTWLGWSNSVSFGYILYCVCFNLYCGGFKLFCNVRACVCVCVCVCVGGGVVMWGNESVEVLECGGVLVICILYSDWGCSYPDWGFSMLFPWL